MILEHLSREKAEAYRDRRPYAMISITDPDGPEARLQPDPKRVAVLRLAFHDFTQASPRSPRSSRAWWRRRTHRYR